MQDKITTIFLKFILKNGEKEMCLCSYRLFYIRLFFVRHVSLVMI
jgi:hypothetical protein